VGRAEQARAGVVRTPTSSASLNCWRRHDRALRIHGRAVVPARGRS
jgi:hypothetical protein